MIAAAPAHDTVPCPPLFPDPPASETRLRTVPLAVRPISDAQAMQHDDIAVSLARRYARSEGAIDDLVQEGRLGLLHAASLWREDGGAAFRTFAFYHVRARILRAAQKERRRGLSGGLCKSVEVKPSSLDDEDDEGRTQHDRIGCPATQKDKCVRDATLAAAVDALPDRLRRVVVLALEGHSAAAIAQTLGVAPGTVHAAMTDVYRFLASKSLERRIGRRRREQPRV